MKSFFVLLVVLCSTASFASQYKKFTKNFTASTEEELVMLVESAIPGILNLTDRKVLQDLAYENCSPRLPRYMQIDLLNVSKFYKYDSGNLNPIFHGQLFFRHTRCKKER